MIFIFCRKLIQLMFIILKKRVKIEIQIYSFFDENNNIDENEILKLMPNSSLSSISYII